MEKISILITDDHTLLRQALALLLNSDSRFEVVGEAGNGEEAVALAVRLRPRVVLMDINMPGLNGIEATKQIRKLSPSTRVLALSMYAQVGPARQMLKVGAMGYLTKTSPKTEMIEALLEVIKGCRYICQELREGLMKEGEGTAKALLALTLREIEILQLVREGASSREIADILHVSPKTVGAHRHHILKKLKLKSTIELLEFIHKHGMW